MSRSPECTNVLYEHAQRLTLRMSDATSAEDAPLDATERSIDAAAATDTGDIDKLVNELKHYGMVIRAATYTANQVRANFRHSGKESNVSPQGCTLLCHAVGQQESIRSWQKKTATTTSRNVTIVLPNV